MPINVMLVDDSSVVRGLITRALEQDPEIKVLGNATDGKIAIDIAQRLKPDIILLDIEMPNMDGITAIPLLLQASPNTRIIMASKLTRKSASISMQALSLGAADYIAKPEMEGLETFYRELREKIKALASGAKRTTKTEPAKPASNKKSSAPAAGPVQKPIEPATAPKLQPAATINTAHALTIASSTGGPQALITLFTAMKGKPLHIPIFITQHMPAVFTSVLAEHIATASGFPCSEGKDGEIAKPGHVYIAPGDFHMLVKREGKNAVIRINQDERVNFCRPAADPMFVSLSKIYGKHLVALVLTGMGRDGAEGAQVIADNGGVVLAQDEKTSIVYGMPKAAAERGVCRAILPLPEIAGYLLKNC